MNEKEKFVARVTDTNLVPITGYSALIVPGSNLWVEYSDKTQVTTTVDTIDSSCIDNPATGQYDVIIRIKLKKEEQ